MICCDAASLIGAQFWWTGSGLGEQVVVQRIMAFFYLMLGQAHIVKQWWPIENLRAYAQQLWSFPLKSPLNWFKTIYAAWWAGYTADNGG